MATPTPSIAEHPVAQVAPDAMAIVATERFRQHEKIVRLRALREAAEATQGPESAKKALRPGRPWIPA